jgi:hypothetical protein
MLLIGIVIGAVLFGGAAAIASGVFTAEPATARVFVDGTEMYAEAYMINDFSYFKLRDLTRALDIGVWYDEDKDHINIETDIGYDPKYTGTRKTVGPQINPLQKPVSINVNNKRLFDLDMSMSEAYSATFTIVEISRGVEAADFIKNANVHNPSAGIGKEYVLAWIRAKITDSKDRQKVVLSDIRMNIQCYSSDGLSYVVCNPANINPINEQPKVIGDTLEGYFAFAVDRNDPEPRIKLGELADGSGDAWFALYD